jgi:hypothetical protein
VAIESFERRQRLHHTGPAKGFRSKLFTPLQSPGTPRASFRNLARTMLRRWAIADRPLTDRDALEQRHGIDHETPSAGHAAGDTEPHRACRLLWLTQGRGIPRANRSGRPPAGFRGSGARRAADAARHRAPCDPRAGEGRPGVRSGTVPTRRMGDRMAGRSASTKSTSAIVRLASSAVRPRVARRPRSTTRACGGDGPRA